MRLLSKLQLHKLRRDCAAVVSVSLIDGDLMSLTIPHEYAAFIRDSVASGRFGSEDEVVFEALRLLQRHEQKLAALRAEIQVGLDDLDAGDASELDVEDIIRRGRERMKKSL